MASGLYLKEIAFYILKIPDKTAEYHSVKLRKLLNTDNLVLLVHCAIRSGLVKLMSWTQLEELGIDTNKLKKIAKEKV
jgi:hypothetical protein